MNKTFGKILQGNATELKALYNEFNKIPVDLNLLKNKQNDYLHKHQQTIKKAVEISAYGTFNCKKIRTLRFEPTDETGWWFKRTDIADSELVEVACRNVHTEIGSGVRNIVLDGDIINYVKLIEHMIALKAGLDIDNLLICIDSDDPPLFESGSTELIDALNSAGRKKTRSHQKFFTVKETVSAQWSNGSFLTISPPEEENPQLNIDCAVNYNNIMGEQRLKFTVTPENFYRGAEARTDASFKHAILCKTIGKFFPSTRRLGYNSKNVLIAGQSRYYNTPRLVYRGKSLESVWHRATLDLLAAIALISEGRFIGNITSYKAGHAQDVDFINLLYNNDMLKELNLTTSLRQGYAGQAKDA